MPRFREVPAEHGRPEGKEMPKGSTASMGYEVLGERSRRDRFERNDGMMPEQYESSFHNTDDC